MGIFMWIIFGALVGWLASLIMKPKKGGLIRNIIIGIVGAFIGGYIGSFLGIGSVDNFSVQGFLIAIGGAVLLIWILKILKI